MKTIRHQNLECVEITNGSLSMLVTRSVGPRVLTLSAAGGENIFAELPDQTIDTPGQVPFHFYGGHRLWLAPEEPDITYLPDDKPVDVRLTEAGCELVQPVQDRTGVVKSISVELPADESRVRLQHKLTNRGDKPITCAPWAITQFKLGGTALVPLNTALVGDNPTLPNRSVILWPYTDINSASITWGNEVIQIEANSDVPLKVGIPNPRGWLAYWRAGVLFVKRAPFDPQAEYWGYGSTSECYCNHQFLEMETLGPYRTLHPGESACHAETWYVYPDFDWAGEVNETVDFIESQTGEPTDSG